MAKGDFPEDGGGRDTYDGPKEMGLSFETGGPLNQPENRSSEYSWGKFSPTADTKVISVEDIFGDPMGVFGGSPDTGFAGGPGGKVVQEKNAEARPA